MRILFLICFALTTLLAAPAAADLILPERREEPAPEQAEPAGDQPATLELTENSGDAPGQPQTVGTDEPTRTDAGAEPEPTPADPSGDDDTDGANAAPTRETAEAAEGENGAMGEKKQGCGVAGSVPLGAFAPILVGLGLLAIVRRRSAEPRA